ncbi:MAG: alpha/beta hydrolase, partial [Actinomycetota bacterium]|nr:alpha/beta hydrolase [Actinomycetota bacterium]
MKEGTTRRLRRTAIGVGVAAAAAAGAVVVERAAVKRLRGRADPDAGEDLTELPPEETEVTSFDGTRLHVRMAGPKDAPTLVFLHGITLDMTTWHFQWKYFSDTYRCVLVDLRAHGRSSRPPSGDYSLVAMGKDIKHVLDAVVPDGRAILIGHSMGGMALLSFAHQFPEEFGRRVSGAVFADTAASDVLREVFGEWGARLGNAFRRIGDRYRQRIELAERLRNRVRSMGADLTFLTAWVTNFGPEAVPSHVEHVARISADTPVEVWVHTLRDLFEMDLVDALEHIRVPSLVIVGDRDLITPKV